MNSSGVPPQSALIHSLQSQGKHTFKNPAQQASAPSKDASAAEVRRQEALQLVERTLAKGYEALNAKAGKTGPFKAFEPLTAEKAASNILGFIERRLQKDAAEGATQEQLEARLEAGLAGFKRGFAEASEKLKALSMLSPEIKQDIGQTYDLVLKGIEDLRERFVEQLAKPPAEENKADASARQESLSALYQGHYQVAMASRFNFQVLTAEGDKVTISASLNQAQAGSYREERAGESSSGGLSVVSASNSQLSWSVRGDLNADELTAIEALLGQVNKLADSFFSGNLDRAFDQALSLGYDQSQIAAFSLSLTQVEVQKVTATYQRFADEPVEGLTQERLLPLGNFVKEILEALDTASTFAEPKALLADLSGKMLANDSAGATGGESPSDRFRSFVELVLDSLREPSES